MSYKTTSEIRRANLASLVRERGTQRALADVIGIAAAQISQWVTAAPDAKTGTPRNISDESARNIEAAANKPRGWMDHDHSPPAESTGTVVALAGVKPLRPPLEVALPVVLDAIAACAHRDKLGAALNALLADDAPAYRQRITELLAPDAAQQSLENHAA